MYRLDLAWMRDLMRRAINHRDYGWSVASSYVQILANILVQIILIPLYLQYLGKAQFGVLMIVLGGINYLGLGITWASSGFQRVMGEMFAHDEITAMQRVLGLGRIIFFLYAALTASFIFLLVWGVGDVFISASPDVMHDVIIMLAIGIAYMVVIYDLNVERLALIAMGKQAYANMLMTLSLVVFAVAVGPVLAQGKGLPGVMVANLIGAIVARVTSYVILRRLKLSPRMPTADDLGVLRRLMGAMGMGYALYGALLLTLLQADPIILGILGGATLVADYVLVWKVADVAMQALWRLPESLVPYLVHMDAKNEGERMRSIYFSARKGMIALAAIVAVLYALFGADIVSLWVGADHAPDVPWAYVLAGGALFWMVVARLPVVYAFSMVKLRPLVSVVALEVVAKITLLLVLFSTLGLYAPLVAMNVVHILGIAFLYQKLFSKCEL